MRWTVFAATLLTTACATNPPPAVPMAAPADSNGNAIVTGTALADPVIDDSKEGLAFVQPTHPAVTYPQAKRGDTVDTQFGVAVADPYRWLENDVRTDAEVAAWVAAENQATNAVLDTLPLRDTFKKRMTALYDYERFGVPRKRGGQYFYTHNTGLQNQSVLFVRDGLDGPGGC